MIEGRSLTLYLFTWLTVLEKTRTLLQRLLGD